MDFLKTILKDNQEQHIGGLTEELRCFYIAQKYHKATVPLLFVCNSLYEANKYYQMLQNYERNTFLFPMDDFITSEVLAVSPDLKMMRLETLHALKEKQTGIVVTNLMGYLRYLPLFSVFQNSYISLKKGMEYSKDALLEKLYTIGYERETIVDKSGTMAERGFVVDIFPIHEENPIRLEFWGDEIDSIRIFDINTQLTIQEISTIEIMPATEFLVTGDKKENVKQRDLISYGPVSSLRDYMPNSILVYNDYEDLISSYQNLIVEMKEYSQSISIDVSTSYMHSFVDIERKPFFNMCKFDNGQENAITYTSFPIQVDFRNPKENVTILKKYLEKYTYVIICVSNRYQANKILDELQYSEIVFTDLEHLMEHKINIVIYKITSGFLIDQYAVISEREFFHQTSVQEIYKTNFKYGTRIKNITKLQIGDYVVHNIHGIGRYCGIKTIDKNHLKKDYLQIEYRDGDKLYIPVEKIDMISKYSSQEGFQPKLNKLGSLEWEKTKLKARKRAQDIAQDLLKLYALREMSVGFAYDKDDENQIAFEKEFIFEETPDQLKAIEDIKKDMEEAHPMDRLLCGDVGYGKTEVAFRAVFKAILSGKQVAMLCPTTILSNQHYQNAIQRFQSFPVTIRLINRFVSSKEVDKTFSEIQEGKVDFVIGTHKLLNKNLHFKNLGLLVIDEEQRFGVTHKEKIKQYKENIDVLTLSATPIPRTLQMSLSGLRGLSLIETPPNNRYPVQTYVLSYNQKIMKDAIYKELSRHGQVFLLYNHVDDIANKAKEIEQLVPGARVVYAHGRMSKQELEDVMVQFINGEYDVLVCTTIIETGIDIPNVNTLIVMEADRFGLSQLYQLRGRVGRTNKIAYCYLMYYPGRILTDVALKRLHAIKEFTELGSGFSIAMRDLSIRGAGDMLGSEQAGFIDSVGIELFSKMLQEEIDRLKGNVVKEEETEMQPLIDVNTYVDDQYVEEEDLKIEIHKKINEIDGYEKLEMVKKELEDRFGKVSDHLLIYMHEELFEHLANELSIDTIRQTEDSVTLTLTKELSSQIHGEKLFIETLQIHRSFRFGMRGNRLWITLSLKNLEKHFIYYLLELLEAIKKSI